MSWTSVFSTKRWEFSTPRGDDGMRFEDRRGLVQFCTPRLVKACELENLNFFQAPVLLPVKDPNINLSNQVQFVKWNACYATLQCCPQKPSPAKLLIGISNRSSHIIALCRHINAPWWQSAMYLCCCFLQFGSLFLVSTGQTTKSHSEKTQ